MQIHSGRTDVFALWPVITLNRQTCDNPDCPAIHTMIALTFIGFFWGISF